ncbi:hypothetical protein I3F58_07370 [Streptomyces sp. MUM 203J]|uniref:hypothetical protein n=1 Tax=Streptomyces sp. MUM 203J TaxID=2791990 RepID=UPI001F040927|nr:hypothetical protein [Streptomyces sp. MUM 203J]MCH0539383.1 hypothetical protein [Streptomyces sp. MUM 203J]
MGIDGVPTAEERTCDGTELPRQRPGREEPGPGRIVSGLVPAGQEAYLRIFHRFEAADGSGRTRSRREWAEAAGVLFHGEPSHHSLPGGKAHAGNSLRRTGAGVPDARSRQALARCLAEVTGDQAVFFAYDPAALVRGEAGPLVDPGRAGGRTGAGGRQGTGRRPGVPVARGPRLGGHHRLRPPLAPASPARRTPPP